MSNLLSNGNKHGKKFEFLVCAVISVLLIALCGCVICLWFLSYSSDSGFSHSYVSGDFVVSTDDVLDEDQSVGLKVVPLSSDEILILSDTLGDVSYLDSSLGSYRVSVVTNPSDAFIRDIEWSLDLIDVWQGYDYNADGSIGEYLWDVNDEQWDRLSTFSVDKYFLLTYDSRSSVIVTCLQSFGAPFVLSCKVTSFSNQIFEVSCQFDCYSHPYESCQYYIDVPEYRSYCYLWQGWLDASTYKNTWVPLVGYSSDSFQIEDGCQYFLNLPELGSSLECVYTGSSSNFNDCTYVYLNYLGNLVYLSTSYCGDAVPYRSNGYFWTDDSGTLHYVSGSSSPHLFEGVIIPYDGQDMSFNSDLNDIVYFPNEYGETLEDSFSECYCEFIPLYPILVSGFEDDYYFSLSCTMTGSYSVGTIRSDVIPVVDCSQISCTVKQHFYGSCFVQTLYETDDSTYIPIYDILSSASLTYGSDVYLTRENLSSGNFVSSALRYFSRYDDGDDTYSANDFLTMTFSSEGSELFTISFGFNMPSNPFGGF